MSRERYDGVELRMRMAVCLSAAELRELCESLTGAPLEAATADVAAREIVRHFEAHDDLATLVAHLRDAKPLVEWPDPEPPAIEAAPTTEITEIAAPAELAAPAPTLVDADAGPGPEPDASDPPEPARWIPPGHDDPSRPREAEAPRSGIDPRILIAVASLTVIAAIVAFAAGRASGPAAAETAAAIDPAVAVATGTGPAARAARALDRALGGVARACELDDEGVPSTLALAAAYEQCGPPPPNARPARVPRAPAEPRPDATEERPDPNPVPAELRRPAAASLVSGCVGACDAKHGSCKAVCGREPTEGSKYAFFQTCLSKCLTEASKCRVACEP